MAPLEEDGGHDRLRLQLVALPHLSALRPQLFLQKPRKMDSNPSRACGDRLEVVAVVNACNVCLASSVSLGYTSSMLCSYESRFYTYAVYECNVLIDEHAGIYPQ